MTQSNEITVVGNLTADPELRYTQNGIPVANITIASSKRVFDRETNQWKDGKTTFFRGSVWREMAEHVAASFSKGQRVIATGSLDQENYKDREGNDRQGMSLEIDDIGPSVRFGTTTFTRKSAGESNGQSAPAVAPQAQPQVSAPAPAQAPAPQPQYAAPAPQPVGVPAGVAATQSLPDDAF